MEQVELNQLLSRGGMTTVRQRGAGEAGEMVEVTKYNSGLDPAGAEQLGMALSKQLEAHGEVVLVWQDPEDLVLGHIVARELGVTVARAFDADGLIEFVGRFPQHAAVVILADMFRDETVLRALDALVAQRGGHVSAYAALATSGSEPPNLSVVSLGTLDGAPLATGLDDD